MKKINVLEEDISNPVDQDAVNQIVREEINKAVADGSISNYDDTEIRNEINTINQEIPRVKEMVWENLCVFNPSRVVAQGLSKTINDDGSVTVTYTATSDKWVNVSYDLVGVNIETGKNYLAVVDWCFDVADQFEGGTSADGNVSINLVRLADAVNTSDDHKMATESMKDVICTIGSRKNVKTIFTNVSSASRYYIIIQPPKLLSGKTYTVTIRNVCLAEIKSDYSTSNGLFETYGYQSHEESTLYVTAEKSKYAEVAKSLEGDNTSRAIELWGDSLVNQNYGKILGNILGREVQSFGYGGKKSTYIRDKFLENSDKNKTIVINIGRNNSQYTDVIVDDIRAMVSAIPHNRYLICCPPNGGYLRELKETGDVYHLYPELEERLSREYQHHFLNTRLSSIYSYDFGGIKLLSSFTQPSIGGTVEINVSDTAFLTTYNTYDAKTFGEDLMKKICIGDDMNKMDVYSVVSVADSTHMTVKLEEQNSTIASGGTVQNNIDDGGTSSIIYKRVIQYADWYCYKNETTASTYRKDSIHMSDKGIENIAKNVSRAISVLNI